MQLKINVKRYGFTLAEVLITLGIIGVVAALTIPVLVQNADERATVSALKKSYSTLSNAYKLAEQENGTPDTWGTITGTMMINNIKPYLNVVKYGTNPGIKFWYLDTSMVSGVYDWWGPALTLEDGSFLFGQVINASCLGVYGSSMQLQNVCGVYNVDLNGTKNPNQYGRDIFTFYLTKYGIFPVGTSAETAYSFARCIKINGFGDACSAWVLYNENMDYLHCSGLSWNGPTKCN